MARASDSYTTQIGWALNQSGQTVHISEVVRGKACHCVCLSCGHALIAHKGRVYRAHFKHAAESNCAGESALHRAAKEVLLNAASTGAPFTAPASSGEISATDSIGVIQEQSWSLPSLDAVVTHAALEAQLSPALRADAVIAITGSQTALAIEIFVTHAKNEVSRALYADLRHDAIEIDLSELHWDADRDTLRAAVLHAAPRQWLYRDQVREAEHAAGDALRRLLRARESALVSFLDDVAAYLREEERLTSDAFPWPVLESDPGSAPDLWSPPVRRAPQLETVNKKWRREGSLWVGSGSAGPRTPVIIEIALRRTRAGLGSSGRPTLVVYADPDRHSGGLQQCLYAEWRNVEAWQQKLNRLAYEESQNPWEPDTDWLLPGLRCTASKFSLLSDREKMKLIARYWIKTKPPSRLTDDFHKWGVSYEVWTSTIWYLEIAPQFARGSGNPVYADDILARNDYALLFRFVEHELLHTEREADIEFWLEKQAERGVLVQDRFGGFNPGRPPGATFRPYWPERRTDSAPDVRESDP